MGSQQNGPRQTNCSSFREKEESPLSNLLGLADQLAIRSTSAVTTSKSGARAHPASHSRPNAWTWASGDCVVRAEHAHTGAKFGATEGHHVLSDVGSYHLSVLRSSVVENPLHKVVPILVAGDVNQRDASAIATTLADTVKIPAKKVSASNLQAFLNYLGGKLIGAVLSRVANDVVNGTATVRRTAMFADVLNTPVPKLPVSDNVNVGKDFLDARTLRPVRSRESFVNNLPGMLTLSSSRQFSKIF